MDNSAVLDEVAELRERINGDPEPVPEVLPRLLALLQQETDPEVLGPIIEAVGVARDERGSLELLAWAEHSDPAIRLEVVHAIPGGAESFDGTTRIAEALVRLSRDESHEVRDWATFGLGTILEIDTSDVREALFARAWDVIEDVRDEALVGLAHRRDRRALPLVQAQLATDHVGPLVWEAVEYLGDPILSAIVQEWLADNPESERVASADRACDAVYQAARLARHAALLASVERLIDEHGLDMRVSLRCELLSTDVALTSESGSPGWVLVDGLLDRVENDIERAAHLVVFPPPSR